MRAALDGVRREQGLGVTAAADTRPVTGRRLRNTR
jgi:hypothetical protein